LARDESPPTGSLAEVAGLFLKLGLMAFGGPAAHVALMREVVDRRHWIRSEQFGRMFAACNLIPGPTSTELAIYLGYKRAGWRALILAGTLFIVPAMVLMLIAARAYSQYGSARPTTSDWS
jgi:chromate transporter